ncbi:helix-turn-helix transcriptional regulator [Streptomyces sp. NPDC049881]|uniref:helix-turn-helix domain-containing protein n=1 Tax=Streptomyces sp. NPDC049881 TaxID=3155778 RepID=UPI0034414DEC
MDDERAQRIGTRVRMARLRRGLTLKETAQAAGVSTGFLSMVENGKRLLDSSRHIAALAEVLRTTPSELTGRQLPAPDRASADAHAAVPALRLALMGAGLWARPPGPPPPESVLAARVAEANSRYHAAAYGVLAASLPDLLADLHAATGAHTGHERRRLLRLLVAAYHPATVMLLKYLNYTDLAFIAVTRAAEVAAELEDPAHTALSGFFTAHVLMTAGSPGQALQHATDASATLEPHLSTPAAHALLGELHLISASAITLDRNRSGASRIADVLGHLKEATALAKRTGESRAWHLNFGAANIGIHRVSLNTDLHQYSSALAAGSVPQAGMSSLPAGRQAAFHTDLGRSLAHTRGNESRAVVELLTAERLAPQRVRGNPLVAETLRGLVRRRLPDHTRRDLQGLAHRIGMTSS